MLACEQDVSSFPRRKQQYGHGQRDFGLDSWEKLWDTLNALRELRIWVPKDGWEESEPESCMGLTPLLCRTQGNWTRASSSFVVS